MSMEDRWCQRIIVQIRHVIEDISNGQYKLFDSGLAKKVYDAKVEIQWRGNHLIVVVYR